MLLYFNIIKITNDIICLLLSPGALITSVAFIIGIIAMLVVLIRKSSCLDYSVPQLERPNSPPPEYSETYIRVFKISDLYMYKQTHQAIPRI